MVLIISKSNRISQGNIESPEMVERKGKGHPDSLVDAAAEACSQAYCLYSKHTYGKYHYHNLDKGILVGGRAIPEFGGGMIYEPFELEIIGRAMDSILNNGKIEFIPVRTICRDAIYNVLEQTFHSLDLNKHVIVDARIKMGSFSQIGLFKQEGREDGIPLATDTSIGVGYAPYSPTEQLVLNIEKYLNSVEFKKKCPASGEDIKVMGLRKRKMIEFTVSNAIISKYVLDKSEYLNVVREIQDAVFKVCEKYNEDHDIQVHINTSDNMDKGIMFLTITGTSAEAGDDGQVGRGNRVNGLITPGRVQTIETVSGKNPNHIGKIYSIIANRAAHRIILDTKGDVLDCSIRIVNQIGLPINHPWLGDIEIISAQNTNFDQISKNALEIIQDELNDFSNIRERMVNGEEKTW